MISSSPFPMSRAFLGTMAKVLVRTMKYRQQIKTFHLKYIFLAGWINITARSEVMKLSENYPYQEIYEESLS